MKTSTVKNLLRATLLAGLACALPSLAAQDNVGLGNGSDGAAVVSGPQTVINAYARVTRGLTPGATAIEVDDAKGFGPDDLVMVLQTTGSNAASLAAPVETLSVPLDDNGVGRWELARLQKDAVDGTTLRLTAPLVHAYLGQYTQVIRVPEYTSLTIQPGASLVPEAWNGSTGGVLAFLAQGTLSIASRPTLAASDTDVAINAVGRGFQGGLGTPDSSGALFCSELERTSPGGAQKGEGITALRFGKAQTGRGRVANAGGGGVCVKSGGGGGGNGGLGGNGGNSYADEGGPGGGNRPVGGQGGAKLTFTPDFPGDRLLMGGGGGVGHFTRDSGSGMKGGSGGGIIFIRANALVGAGLIQANGAPGSGSSYADSGSGGGAGGTLYLRIAGQAECSAPQAQGGKGGDAASRSGPGGGGAGGRIILQKGWGGCDVDDLSVSGVNPGTQPDPADPSYGATRGGNGTVTVLKGGFSAQELPVPVVVTPGEGAHLNTPTPTYSGTLNDPSAPSAGTQVEVYVDDRPVGRTIVDPDGSWSLHPTGPDDALSPGPHTVHAVLVNPDQGVASAPSSPQTFTVDTSAPQVSVKTPAEGSTTRDSTPDYTGTVSDDGPGPLEVTIRVDDGPPAAATVTDTTWSYTPGEPLAPGSHTVTVTVTDEAGNTSTDSTTFTVEPSQGTPPDASGASSQAEVDRDFLGGGCASAGGAPAALAMVGAVFSALVARRRRR